MQFRGSISPALRVGPPPQQKRWFRCRAALVRRACRAIVRPALRLKSAIGRPSMRCGGQVCRSRALCRARWRSFRSRWWPEMRAPAMTASITGANVSAVSSTGMPNTWAMIMAW